MEIAQRGFYKDSLVYKFKIFAVPHHVQDIFIDPFIILNRRNLFVFFNHRCC